MKINKSIRKFVSSVTSCTLALSVMNCIPLSQSVVAAQTEWKFDFGGSGATSGFTEVSASTAYNKNSGYGFAQTANVKDVTASGKNELSDAVQFTSTDTANTFNVDLPNGLYEMTVKTGNISRTSVYAEDCLQIINMTGNNAEDTIQIPITDGQLNIMMTAGRENTAYSISSLELKKISDSTATNPTVWVCGDSTVCNYYPRKTSTQAGWGQILEESGKFNGYQVRNLAASGQYAQGFLDAGQFEAVKKYGKSGDYYIISIGINDTNYSTKDEYKEAVSYMTKTAQSKGMKVILVKQQGRADDISRSKLLNSRWWGDILDTVGNETGAEVVDLFNSSQDYWLSIGQDKVYDLFMENDTLHPNRAGAEVLATLFMEQVKIGSSESGTKGDINEDGKIDSFDVTMMRKYIIDGKSTFVSDVNSDGKTDKTDLKMLADFVLGRIKGFDGNSTENHIETYLTEPHTIRMIGDSTMCNYNANSYPQTGWGQVLSDYFDDKVNIVNYARGGRSSKMFINEGTWDTVYNELEKGDYLFISFGINDGNYNDDSRYAPVSDGTFQNCMQTFIDGAIEKGATPILFTTVLGYGSYKNGEFVSSYQEYCDATKQLATDNNIPCIDLNSLMVEKYNTLGYDAVYDYYMISSNGTDKTHFTEAGANAVAEIAADALDDTALHLGTHVVLSDSSTQTSEGARQAELLDRGMVAVKSGNNMLVSWRYLGTDTESTTFKLYRDNTLIYTSGEDSPTCYMDNGGSATSVYKLETIENGKVTETSSLTKSTGNNYFDIPLNPPADMTMPDGSTCSYSANDCSPADLDGDGEYELVIKWDPSNSKDNAQDGYTGNVYLEGIKLDGTSLWRIDLGKNIRAGAHYTQFMVYDLDGDGYAEVVCKTADGTTDAKGNVVGDKNADYRTTAGRILSGPEYLTLFDGRTGKILDTIDYEVGRGDSSTWKAVWGDEYGNIMDRFLACVAYLNGETPSVVMCRGYYTRTALVAYNVENKKLVKQWIFDSDDGGTDKQGKSNYTYRGQGTHSVMVADCDGDGFDEIVYGAAVIDHDGRGLYNTELGHGDALHVGDFLPSRPGLEIFMPHEETFGSSLRDAATGEILVRINANEDTGRGMCGNFIGNANGAVFASTADSVLYDCYGNAVGNWSDITKWSMNSELWFTETLERAVFDRGCIDQYGKGRVLTASGVSTNNATKNNPCLTADILGDWREELVMRAEDSSYLRVFCTTYATDYRIFSLMHDIQYREQVATQNVSYNQPPNPSFYLGTGYDLPELPNIYSVSAK